MGTRRAFVGGMNIADDFGSLHRVNATFPLACLTVNKDVLHLAGIASLARILPSKHTPRGEVVCVFRSIGLLTPGIGIHLANDEINYFWCLNPTRPLHALRTDGYPIGPARRPRHWRLLTGHAET